KHSILTANSNGNTPTHTQKDIQPCETGCLASCVWEWELEWEPEMRTGR
ncbi:hypothetical protein KR054_000696, partial [Drosophila jambulina]